MNPYDDKEGVADDWWGLIRALERFDRYPEDDQMRILATSLSQLLLAGHREHAAYAMFRQLRTVLNLVRPALRPVRDELIRELESARQRFRATASAEDAALSVKRVFDIMDEAQSFLCPGHVLQALARDVRSDYDEHLERCARCRSAIEALRDES